MKGTIWDRALMGEAFERAHAFLAALPERSVVPTPAAIACAMSAGASPRGLSDVMTT